MCNEESIADFIPVDLVSDCGCDMLSIRYLIKFFQGHQSDGSGGIQNGNYKTRWNDNLQLLYRRSATDYLGSFGVVSNREDADSSFRWDEKLILKLLNIFLIADDWWLNDNFER